MIRLLTHRLHLILSLFIFVLVFSGCTRSGSTAFSSVDAKSDENARKLMSLAVGMTKGQVYELTGIANYVEGYDWGSVWFYKISVGNNLGTLSDKEVAKNYMPVVFDNTDRVMGYGIKFYDQTISDLGAGQF